MARPIKEGMDYYPHDTDSSNDEKIEALRAIHGNDGYVFYFVMLERIYRTSNAELDVSDAETRQILARKVAVTNEKFEEMIVTAIKYGCFDKEMYEKKCILTSNGIKRRSNVVFEKRLSMRVNYGNRVSDIETTPETTPEMGVETPQSKVKESKVKKSKDLAATGGGETALEIIPDLLANKKKKKWNDFGVEAKEINSIFAIVGKINPHLNYRNTTQREAAAELIHVHGIENMKKVAEVAVSLYNKPYAPAITTPYQLRDKYAQLKAFVEKESNKGGKIVIGSEF